MVATHLVRFFYGTELRNLAAFIGSKCVATFDPTSVLDLLLLPILFYVTITSIVMFVFQLDGYGLPQDIYYRVCMSTGVFANYLVNFLLGAALSNAGLSVYSPLWPPCGGDNEVPPYAIQLSWFIFVSLLFSRASQVGFMSTYQLVVFFVLTHLVTVVRIVVGYNSPLQAFLGAGLGVALAMLWYILTIGLLAVGLYVTTVVRTRRKAAATSSRAGFL